MSDASVRDQVAAELTDGLERLDRLLVAAIAEGEADRGPNGDPFRGLHIDIDEVARLLARPPGEPLLSGAPGMRAPETLMTLAEELGLSGFEVDVVLIALAPELDLRYERLYAYLQDDVTRKRPTVDLVLHLLCENAAERLARRSTFQADSPLLQGRVVELVSDSTGEDAPLLARALRLDDQIVRLLLGTGGLDARLAGFCDLAKPVPPRTRDASMDGAATELRAAIRARRSRPFRLYFQGPKGSGRREAAESLAAERNSSMLAADLAQISEGLGPVLVREARLHDALLFLWNVDELRKREARQFEELGAAVVAHPGPVVFAGEAPWPRPATSLSKEPLGMRVVAFGVSEPAARRDLWQRELKRSGFRVKSKGVDALARRFRLTDGQIREAVAEASGGAPAKSGHEALERLFVAARAQSAGELSGLAVKLRPAFHWDDIVLPEDSLAQLRELCIRVEHRERVLGDWGFEARLPLGRGVTALFGGPPGTGKTMAAEVVAGELGLDLFRIDLSGIVSKWIGETEKNIDRVFRAADGTSAILLFDEADALFGKRTEVRDSHDRYANVEISYLLQKMEEHDGVAILATNRIADLDEAFTRRLSHVVRFPFPEVDERTLIWESVWPPETPLAESVNCGLLARELAFSGAEIRNVALAAAFFAAAAGSSVEMEHLLHAARREYEKAGKSFPQGAIAELAEAPG